MRARRAVLTVFLAVFCAGGLSAQSYIGTNYSFYRSGATFGKAIDDDAFWEVGIGVEYGNSVLRQSRQVGGVATFTYNFIVKDWQHKDGGSSRLYAGPGVILGMVKAEHYGMLMGLMANIGYEYEFDFPLVLGIGVLPTLGTHICNDSGEGTLMELYKNGLRWSFCPQISIKYNITGSTSVKSVLKPKKSTYYVENGHSPRITYGLEWTYSALLAEIYHHNYTSPTGRVDNKGIKANYINNGFALAHVGINCNRRLNISLYGGYGCIHREERAFPLSLRWTWFYGKQSTASRWFNYFDAGCAFRTHGINPSAIAKIGGGYRVSLSRSVKLDLMVAYQFAYGHLTIDDEDGDEVPQSRIRRNDNYINSINFSIGITL